MRRRGLLLGGAATAAGAAALGWPGWLRKAFLEGRPGQAEIKPEASGPGAMVRPPTTPTGTSVVKSAVAQASASGKKVLVLVIPGPGVDRFERGHAIGEYLNHGSDADLAPLASAVVVCATKDDLGAETGARALGNMGDPLLVVLTPSPQGLQITALRDRLPELFTHSPDRTKEEENRLIDERIAVLSRQIAQGLGPARGDLKAQAEQVREAIVKKRPGGGQWGIESGCGTDYEEGPEQSEMVKCGMGHVPERSQRFLHFLTAEKT